MILAFAVVICSCKQADNSTVSSVEKPRVIDDHTALDSAWKLGRENRHQDSFEREFEINVDSLRKIKTRLMIGSFFGTRKYMIIKRESPVHFGLEGAAHFIDVYYYTSWNDRFTKVIHHAEDLENYVSDTIQDINDDGRKDFIANYRTTLKGIKMRYTIVNLAITDSTFSSSGFSSFVFANPIFSISEKTIRGVLHGESGKTEIYKYMWNGAQVDTVEYVYPDPDVKGQFFKGRYFRWDQRNQQDPPVKLKSIPEEYKNLPELSWFIGDSKKQ